MKNTCAECGCELPPGGEGERCPRCVLAQVLFDPETEKANFAGYELLEELGRGGMGVVYRARQTSLNRTVALKLILAGRFASEKEVRRFRAEAEASARLRHPNIVAIHETGEYAGQQYYSMDYVQGRDLGEFVREGPLPVARAVRLVEIIARAVHYAHTQGILHRDLKPSNILIDADEQPHITDFGLAKRLTPHSNFGNRNSDLTLTGQVLGSPGYLPPEQAFPRFGQVGAASDVYGLGALLYHLLTGRPPCEADTFEEVLHQLQTQDAIPPRLLNPRLPRDLETVCLKCLEKEPDRRYTSALDLAEELQRLLRDEPVQARPPTRVERWLRWCRRKPLIAGLAAALGVAVVTGAIATAWELKQVERTAWELRERVYASDIALAARDLSQTNLKGAAELIKRQIPKKDQPDLRGFEWGYLAKLVAGQQETSFRVNEAPVTCLALTPDGNTLISGGGDSTIRLWNLGSLESNRVFQTLPGRIGSLAISPDGQMLAANSEDGTLTVWDVPSARAVKRLKTSAQPFALCQGSQRLLAPIGNSRKADLYIWNTADWTSSVIATNTYFFALSPDESQLALAISESHQRPQGLALVDLSGRMLRPLEDPGETDLWVYSLCFSPNGKLLAAGYNHGQVSVWRVDDGRLLWHYPTHTSFVCGLAFTPDNRQLATASGVDQYIAIWNTRDWAQAATLTGQGDGILDLKFTTDGQRLISAGRDGTIRFWRPAWVQEQPAPPDALDLAGFLDGTATAVVLQTNSFALLDTRSATVVANHPLPPGRAVSRGALAERSQRLALGYSDGTVDVRDLNSGTLLHQFVAGTNPVFHLQMAPGGTEVAATSVFIGPAVLTGQFTVWSLDPPRRLTVVTEHVRTQAQSSAYSHNGKLLAIARSDHLICLWDRIKQRESLPFLRGHTWEVSSLAFSPDDRWLASASWDGTTRLWNVETGGSEYVFTTGGTYLSFSPNGRTLAVADNFGTLIRLWHLPSRMEMMTLHWGSQFLGTIQFSPDGTVLAAGSDALATGRPGQPADRVTCWSGLTRQPNLAR